MLSKRFGLFSVFLIILAAVVAVDGWVANNHNHNHNENGRSILVGYRCTRSMIVPPFDYHHHQQQQHYHHRDVLFTGTSRRTSVLLWQAAAKDDNEKQGYKFGDLTRAIGRKVTGDDNYQVCTRDTA